jgi:site-specific recombinase XerD
MNRIPLVGPWIRRFLMEHLVGERNLARNTQTSYRDTLRLLIPFVSEQLKKPVDHLAVPEITAELVRAFLAHLEERRKCGITTRNQRLAAIHALARFIAEHCPEHIDWCSQIRAIPFKKATREVIPYLEKPELDALLAMPDQRTDRGRREHALLLFMYNSGTRADETARLTIADLDLVAGSVRVLGKGAKVRHCPLWPATVQELGTLASDRPQSERVFLNRRRQPIARFGIHALVERCAQKAAVKIPSLAKKRVSPHTIRHTTATHLLRAGVDINTVRAWLGHVSLDTTNVYAEIDLEMKAKALAKCEINGSPKTKPWREDASLMAFLRSL